MKNFLKNLFGITKENVQETFEHASKDIKEVVDAVSEDAGKLMAEAKEKLAEAEKFVKDEFTEHVGEPSEIVAKGKKTLTETGKKLKDVAKEEWESATEKFEELKDSLEPKAKDDDDSDIAPKEKKDPET